MAKMAMLPSSAAEQTVSSGWPGLAAVVDILLVRLGRSSHAQQKQMCI